MIDELSIYKISIGALSELVAKTGEHLLGTPDEPTVGSVGQRQIETFPDPEHVRIAINSGVLSGAAIPEHIEALLRVLKIPVLTVAPWVCTRSALESSSLGCWFLDPNIEVGERVARGLAFRFQGLVQQAKWARGIRNKASMERIEKRILHVENEAIQLGYELIRNKNGRRCGVGTRMPSLTDLVDAMLDRGSDYRLLSAIVHHQQWALQQLSFRLGGDDQGNRKATKSEGVNLYPLEKAISGRSVTYLCLRCAEALTKFETSRCRLFGLDSLPIEVLHNNFKDSIENIVKSWRQQSKSVKVVKPARAI